MTRYTLKMHALLVPTYIRAYSRETLNVTSISSRTKLVADTSYKPNFQLRNVNINGGRESPTAPTRPKKLARSKSAAALNNSGIDEEVL